jgi:hypothetical protein
MLETDTLLWSLARQLLAGQQGQKSTAGGQEDSRFRAVQELLILRDELLLAGHTKYTLLSQPSTPWAESKMRGGIAARCPVSHQLHSPESCPPCSSDRLRSQAVLAQGEIMRTREEMRLSPGAGSLEMQRRAEPSETYQNCGKLSLSCSTDSQYSSSMSRSLSRRFLPNL